MKKITTLVELGASPQTPRIFVEEIQRFFIDFFGH